MGADRQPFRIARGQCDHLIAVPLVNTPAPGEIEMPAQKHRHHTAALGRHGPPVSA